MNKNSFFRSASLVLAGAAAASCFASCSKKEKAPEFSADTINIGSSGPLTGGASIYGTAVYNGATMAILEINEAGGLNGTKLAFEMYDDQHKTENVATGYAAMKDKGMQVSLGCVTSAPCLEYIKNAEKDGMFFLTPSASADKVTSYENAFQMCFADSNQGAAAAKLYNANDKAEFGERKIGVLYKSDDDYSTGIYETFINGFSAEEQAAIKTASFTSDDGDSPDFSAHISTLKGCDFIFMPIYYTPASQFIQKAKTTEAFSDTTIYFGCDGFDGIQSMKGFNVEDYPQEISYLSHFNSNATEGAAGEFVKKYKEKYGAETLNQFGASAYDSVYALFDAMKTASESGKKIDGSTSVSDMTAALKGVFTSATFSFNGVTGQKVQWNADGTVIKNAIRYKVNHNG